MSASRRAATVVLVTVALTAGPAAGAAAAAPLLTDTLTCTRESSPDADSSAGSGASDRDTSSSSRGATDSPQLDPKTLEQAQELVDQTRALLTTLISSDDPRAATLVQEFRAMGFTPAVATGWRQRAHDVADALMTNAAPAAQQLAVVFAAAGFSPTPADLRHGPANAQPAVLPGPTEEAAANAVPAVSAAAPAGDSVRAGGAMSAVISQVAEGAELAADSAAQNGPAANDSSGVQVCNQDSSVAAAGGTGTGGTAEAQAWAQDVHDLAQELAQRPDDPDAQAFADKLRDAGFDAQPDAAGNNVSSDVQTRGNTASGDSTQDTDSDSDSGSGSGSGASAQPSNGSVAAPPREGGLDEHVATLSQALAQAQDDPTAKALADKLAEAGFPQADEGETGGSAGGSAGSSAPNRALGDDSSSSPGRSANRSSGDRRPRDGAPDNDPAEDSSDSRANNADSADNADSGERSGQDADSEERQDDERHDADRGGETPAAGSAPAPAAPAPAAAAIGSGGTASWDRLAECESGGDWSIDTGNGYSGVIRTDLQRDDVDHCSSGLGGVLAGIWTTISATLLSRLVS